MDDITKAVHPNGDLYLNSNGWISWDVGEKKITLDGDFTLEQLEFIVTHVRSHLPQTGCNVDRQTAFLSKLGEVLKKYGVTLKGNDNYDAEENYIGADYIFYGAEIEVDIRSLLESMGE